VAACDRIEAACVPRACVCVCLCPRCAPSTRCSKYVRLAKGTAPTPLDFGSTVSFTVREVAGTAPRVGEGCVGWSVGWSTLPTSSHCPRQLWAPILAHARSTHATQHTRNTARNTVRALQLCVRKDAHSCAWPAAVGATGYRKVQCSAWLLPAPPPSPHTHTLPSPQNPPQHPSLQCRRAGVLAGSGHPARLHLRLPGVGRGQEGRRVVRPRLVAGPQPRRQRVG
jgi:hypothetical protein